MPGAAWSAWTSPGGADPTGLRRGPPWHRARPPNELAISREAPGRAPGAARCSPALVPRRRRVAPGGHPPGAPTDPDVRDYRIRLFGARTCYAGSTRLESCGRGSG
jgi:hypothetical protein